MYNTVRSWYFLIAGFLINVDGRLQIVMRFQINLSVTKRSGLILQEGNHLIAQALSFDGVTEIQLLQFTAVAVKFRPLQHCCEAEHSMPAPDCYRSH